MNTKMPLVTRSRRNPDCRSHCSVQKGRSLSRVTEGRTQRLEAARQGYIDLEFQEAGGSDLGALSNLVGERTWRKQKSLKGGYSSGCAGCRRAQVPK